MIDLAAYFTSAALVWFTSCNPALPAPSVRWSDRVMSDGAGATWLRWHFSLDPREDYDTMLIEPDAVRYAGTTDTSSHSSVRFELPILWGHRQLEGNGSSLASHVSRFVNLELGVAGTMQYWEAQTPYAGELSWNMAIDQGKEILHLSTYQVLSSPEREDWADSEHWWYGTDRVTGERVPVHSYGGPAPYREDRQHWCLMLDHVERRP